MRSRALIISFVLLCFLKTDSFAQIDLGGYYRNELIYIIQRDGTCILGDVNKLRFQLDSKIIPAILLHLEPEYAVLIKTEELPLLDNTELNKVIWDRTYAKISLPFVDLTAGRQRVAWGTGHVFNPTDVFNPFALSFAVAEEERKGVDAVRLEIPFGAASGIDAVFLTDKGWDETKKGIKAKTNIGSYDLSLSYVDFGDTMGDQIGFDAAGEFFALGLRAEVAAISTGEAERFIKGVFGLGYTLEDGWGIDCEYYFNGFGRKEKENYDWPGLFSGDISQLAMNYVYLGLNKILDEITEIRFSFLVNADDSSFIFYPSYTRNVLENLDFSLEALFEAGPLDSEFHPTSLEDPTGFLGSNIVFVKLRYSF